jgi:hypothetical protein
VMLRHCRNTHGRRGHARVRELVICWSIFQHQSLVQTVFCL